MSNQACPKVQFIQIYRHYIHCKYSQTHERLSVCTVGLSIDYHTEHLYWISSGNSTINRCKLDGSALEVLDAVKGKLNKASALAIMGKYSSHGIRTELHTNANVWNNNMLVFCCEGDKLWWADQSTDQIGTCDKSDGGNWKVLRNGTSPMMHMKVYNETVQIGVFVCLCYLTGI